jgi:hypothetical protein
MQLFNIDPVRASQDGPHLEIWARNDDAARKLARQAYPNDNWFDAAQFDVGPLGVSRPGFKPGDPPRRFARFADLPN